ncbi:MAG: elongation factor P [Saprospiraceae bacterium]|nr:elongation factor P [Saprospiraceae bacterium]
MADTSDIRNGLCIEYKHDLWTVVEFQHVKPGKGPAFVRTKLKSLSHGRVVDNTFPSGHKIIPVRIERRKYQYLYNDDMGFHFMNNETFEQVALNAALIDNPGLMKEGIEVEILFHAEEERPLQMEFANDVILKVTYTEPGLKGDTATNTLKPATVETGAEIKVPLFVNEGDLIKIDPKTSAYVSRVKEE